MVVSHKRKRSTRLLLTFEIKAAGQDLQGMGSRCNNFTLHCTSPFWPHCRPVATHLLQPSVKKIMWRMIFRTAPHYYYMSNW